MNVLDEIYNFLEIDNLLTTSGQPSEKQLCALADANYEVIINLALHDDPRYSLPDETGLVEALGMEYIHIPVLFDAPGENDLTAFFGALETNQDRKIHAHCAANMRVTAFLGLYRLIRQGKTMQAAFAPMGEIWEPDDVWSAFINTMAVKYVD
jgi:protein tyrosine phosphatase (PTP) superfamily phosphohydrolase (DUF442 family)